MGVVGAARRGFGRALKNRKIAGTIKSVKPAKNLSTKRAIQDKVVRAVDEGTRKGLKGATPSPHLRQSMSKAKRDKGKELKDISYKWDKHVREGHKANKKLLVKTLGGAAAGGAGVLGGHAAAKRKWPKYKKVMESEIKTVDGKLKLVPKKKK